LKYKITYGIIDAIDTLQVICTHHLKSVIPVGQPMFKKIGK